MSTLRIIYALAICACAAAGMIRINAGGSHNPSIGWRGDTGSLFTGKSAKYVSKVPIVGGSWASVYQSHRYATSGDLRVKIPVPAGTYNLTLLFAETWAGSGSGVRQFVVKVNGANLKAKSANGKLVDGIVDVFAMAGGLHKTLYVPVYGVESIGDFVILDFNRLAGKNNPMVSGIVINGANADALLGGEGITPTVRPAASIEFVQTTLKTCNGTKDFKIPLITCATYGPDGRLYLGSMDSKVWSLSVSKNFRVSMYCMKSTIPKPPAPAFARVVTGVAFDPHSNDLKLFYTSSTHHWKTTKNFTTYASGWTNGKVQSVTMHSPNGCFKDDITDVVTGLPVSNHGHGPNAIVFLPSGEMLIGVGGTTNGGIPGPDLGGIPESPFSGAIISCPSTGTAIKYSNPMKPEMAKVIGGNCTVYASGFRNTFAMTLHTNGKLYATDNGPHIGKSRFATNCEGGSMPPKTLMDRLHLVQPGKCHGHPNANRGECVFRDTKCVKPLLDNLTPSMNGVLEYRANLFGGALKGDLLLSQFDPKNTGQLNRVKLNAEGYIKPGGFVEELWNASGLSIVEGPRGELVIPKLFQSVIMVAKPIYKLPEVKTFVISVMPRRGMAAGATKVTIHGANFGQTPEAKFGDKWCQNVEVLDDNTFTCFTPAGLKNSQVRVQVFGKSGWFAGSGSDYWYY